MKLLGFINATYKVDSINPIQDGPFWDCSLMWKAKKAPPP